MRRAVIFAALALGIGAVSAVRGQSRGWDQLTPEEQWRAWQNYQRYQQLPEPKRRLLDQRFQQFRAMPPEEQQRLRQHYQEYQRFDPGQRQRFDEKYRRWKARPR
ncbi:MAG TPA: DUF3106 domain-containing protein [Candidatus Binatia bacterium]|nr:DUF3106 domain-containing protein [Candidatus Binatia bacterium]